MAAWTPRQVALLGKMTDAEVARRTGRTQHAVLTQRHKLGLPAHIPHRRRWSRREIALLGKIADVQLAEHLSISRRCVLMERRRRGIAPAHPANTPKKFRAQPP